MNKIQNNFDTLDFLFFLNFYINTENMEYQYKINNIIKDDDLKLNTIISNQNIIIQNQQKILDYIETERLHK